MAVMLKSRQEVAHLREAGRVVAETYEALRPHVQPGTSTAELDRIAEDFVRGKGAIPVYKGYGTKPAKNGHPATPPFPATICVAVNDVICHGIPSSDEILREGVRYKGWIGDSCVTFPVGTIDAESQHLLDATKHCLELGIEQARAGKHLGDIGNAIQSYAASQGFSTVYELCGHGVGKSLHEDPAYVHIGRPGTGIRLRPGMVFTIEPMINAGKPEIHVLADQWTVRTTD